MSIQFESVTKTLSNKTVLKNVSFTISKGEILFILGKSGVGKSVTLKHIVGLMKPDSGKIMLDDLPIHSMSENELLNIRTFCGMVFQHPALLDSISIFDNISFGIKNKPEFSNIEYLKEKVNKSLESLGLKNDILDKKPYELSIGMQKRVSIARAIACDPKYLLFDEPTTGLDPVATNTINELILNLTNSLDVTSVVVSHDIISAMKLATRIIFLDSGEILFNGTPQEMRNSKQTLIKEFLAEVP